MSSRLYFSDTQLTKQFKTTRTRFFVFVFLNRPIRKKVQLTSYSLTHFIYSYSSQEKSIILSYLENLFYNINIEIKYYYTKSLVYSTENSGLFSNTSI